MTVRTTARISALAAILVSTITVGAASHVAADAPTDAVVVPAPADGSATDQIVVTFDRPGRALGRAAITADAGAGARSARSFGAQSEIVKLPAAKQGRALETVMSSLAKRPGVTMVEADQIMRAMVANDTYATQQWSLSDPSSGGAAAGIDVAAAWSVSTGDSGLSIAVIDTGSLPHEDLVGKYVPGYDFISDSRIANDGNGRDGDATDEGDWITQQEARSGFFRRCPVGDSSWNGTHVAGTIAASTGNSKGIAGINQQSKILPVRVLGKCGGYTSDIVDGMRWAAGLPVSGVPANGNPARVLNLSLGGSGSCSSTYQGAIDEIRAAGAVVVVAAGNSNANAANYSPASCSGVITVAATGKAGDRSYYSNYGSAVEIAAPGGDRLADNGDTILSTLNAGSTTAGSDAYVKYQGTSMATPHVAGVVSLMLSANSTLGPADIDALLPQMARSFPVDSSCSASLCGVGLLDAGAALAAATGGSEPPPPPPPPPPPSEAGDFGKTSPSNGDTRVNIRRATLSWEPSSGATGYEVCIDAIVDQVCTGTWTDVGTATGARVDGLASGGTYEWQVRTSGPSQVEADDGTVWVFATR